MIYHFNFLFAVFVIITFSACSSSKTPLTAQPSPPPTTQPKPQAFLYQFTGRSMEPTFQTSQLLSVSPDTTSLKVGDLIVLTLPPAAKCIQGTQCNVVKRIIAVEGETIEIKQDKVHVNGKELNEQYRFSTSKTLHGQFTKDQSQLTVPKDHFFVLGDHREYSLDSRQFGFISKTSILGKVLQ